MTRLAVILAAVGLFGGSVWAAPITYTMTVTGSGTLGLSSFTSALVTITVRGDTSSVSNSNPTHVLSGPGIGTITISGLGTATLTDFDIEVGDDQFNSFLDIFDFGVSGLLASVDNPAYATYDLRSSIGPLPSSGYLSPSSTSFPTTLGDFRWTSFVTNGTFTAVVAPEPSTTLLLSTGLLGVAMLRLYRKRPVRRPPYPAQANLLAPWPRLSLLVPLLLFLNIQSEPLPPCSIH